VGDVEEVNAVAALVALAAEAVEDALAACLDAGRNLPCAL